MPEKEQEMQQKMVLYQILSQRIEQLNEQAKLLEQRLMEIETTRQALDDLKKVKEGQEVLIPLGSGCYTHGRTGEPGLLLELGAGVMVKGTLAEAVKAMNEKRAEIEKLSNTLQDEVKNVVSKMNQIGPELQAFLQKSQQAKPEKEPEGGG